jgi:hypothetical protein
MQCQEVLIGLLNKIEVANKEKKTGVLVSLDIKKAFDSISHNYMEEVLKFFNFGENFIKWIKVLCTNREACVIVLNNKLGRNIKLKRGNAQGDTISPFLFNICYQLLLFKLEYDLQIKDLETPVPVSASPLYSTKKPVSVYAKKVFTFADDCNLLCNRDATTLSRLKKILTDFEQISGLECNLDKTNIMLIGGASHNDNEVRNQGFAEKKSLTILGMKISNKLDVDIQVSADHITRKIVENINRWERFNLSLPGRIQIAKTMLYSQINYLGCFLNFSNNTLLAWESLIHNYVKANLNVSKQRAFLPVEFGGLGLFDLINFLDSQKI